MDAPIYSKVHEIDFALHCFYFAWYVGGIFIVDDISNFIAEIALMGCDGHQDFITDVKLLEVHVWSLWRFDEFV